MLEKIDAQYGEADVGLQKLPLVYFARYAQGAAAAAPAAYLLAVGGLQTGPEGCTV
jgi:hypothetical protein